MQRGSPPVDELRAFFDTHYTTSNMRLAVVGKSSLDALQDTVEKTFGSLKYSDVPPRRDKVNPNAPIFTREHAVYGHENPAFGPAQLGMYREVIPLRESHTLKVQFATPPADDPALSETKPYRVISHLLGHESPGSLHKVLTDMGYLTGLSSGIVMDTSDFSLFGMTLTLTPKGIQEKEKVLDLVFQWITLIKQTVLGNPDLISKYHEELRQMSAMNFKFRGNGNPTDFCSSAAELLFSNEKGADLLQSSHIHGDYDNAVAQEFIKRLHPRNCMITVLDSGLEKNDTSWQVEPLYGATYREKRLSSDDMERWESTSNINPQLHIPDLNRFIPTDFSLKCDGPDVDLAGDSKVQRQKSPPTLLSQGTNYRLYHKMDSTWRIPRSCIRVSIISPKLYESPRSMTLGRIYQRVLNDDLNCQVYDASVAGCHYR